MKKELLKIGEMEFCEDHISVTDPSYSSDVWCRLDGIKIKPGIYKCYALCEGEMELEERYGLSIVSTVIFHEDIQEKDYAGYLLDNDLEEAGFVGVDSGMCGFFRDKPDFSRDEWLDLCDQIFNNTKRKVVWGLNDSNSDAFLYRDDKKGACGFFTANKYGDGSYRVSGKKDADSFVVLTIEY